MSWCWAPSRGPLPIPRSEIVVPVSRGGEIIAVLDVDCDRLDDFSATDADALTNIVALPSAAGLAV